MAKLKSTLSLENRVLKFIGQHGLIDFRKKILVAVSGGPDSVCLLHTLYFLREELKIDLYIAHLNHQLRGAESEADAAYVSEVAGRLNLPSVIEHRDVAAYRAERRLSLEEAAREVRYEFLSETARSLGIERVAVGHTQNDQIETILLHIIRGSGTRGLRGLQPLQLLRISGFDLTVIRPMLEIRRQETEEYCSSLGLNPCADASNLSLSPLRNRVRNTLLPLLKEYNSGISESLLRLGSIAQEESAFLEAESSRIWAQVASHENNIVAFSKEPFRKIHPALQMRLLRISIHKILGTLKDIEARHIDEVMEALGKPAGKNVILPAGLVFRVDYDRFILAGRGSESNPFPELSKNYSVRVPGITEIPGWTISAEIIDPTAFKGQAEFSAETKFNSSTLDFSASFDYKKSGDNVILRPRSRGDWFQPLGMAQTKKVGKFMSDARIPQNWRNRVPLICSDTQVLWIAGWRVDERVKVTPATRQILHLKLTRNGLRG